MYCETERVFQPKPSPSGKLGLLFLLSPHPSSVSWWMVKVLWPITLLWLVRVNTWKFISVERKYVNFSLKSNLFSYSVLFNFNQHHYDFKALIQWRLCSHRLIGHLIAHSARWCRIDEQNGESLLVGTLIEYSVVLTEKWLKGGIVATGIEKSWNRKYLAKFSLNIFGE